MFAETRTFLFGRVGVGIIFIFKKIKKVNSDFIKIGNVNIAYTECNKDAANTIFFIPGNSVSKRIWRKQLSSDALSLYRMIAIDFPAHGDSDVADETCYNFAGLGELLSKVVTLLSKNNPYVLAGVSLGTNVVAEMLAFALKPEGLVLAGPSIFGEKYKVEQIAKPGTHVGVVFTDFADDKDLLSYAKETSLSGDEEDVAFFIEDFKNTKIPFRSVLAKSIFDGNFKDEVALLKEKNIPCLIIFGKDEMIVNNDYLDAADLPLWNNMIYLVKGASHLVNVDRPDEFNKLLTEFSSTVFK
jgi:pimeloyl-ACP methyl ester carboxylesterase